MFGKPFFSIGNIITNLSVKSQGPDNILAVAILDVDSVGKIAGF